jgi:hypothetical protein
MTTMTPAGLLVRLRRDFGAVWRIEASGGPGLTTIYLAQHRTRPRCRLAADTLPGLGRSLAQATPPPRRVLAPPALSVAGQRP